jgi:hypothetical protein
MGLKQLALSTVFSQLARKQCAGVGGAENMSHPSGNMPQLFRFMTEI